MVNYASGVEVENDPLGSSAPEIGTPMPIAKASARNRVLLAPMSGVTDLPFRHLANKLGAGLVVSEMVASQELVVDNPDSRLRMDVSGLETSVVQLAGREAQWMGEAAKIAEGAGASVIDINMGCPAKKVTSGYSGSALMRDLHHALTLVEATVDAVSLPVTLKMRLGWDDKTINAPELARRACEAGVQMITVHGRTRCQFYKGLANWPAIAAVKDAIDVPLVANGDVVSSADAKRILQESGGDAVMVGRGAYGRPWLPGYLASDDPQAFLSELLKPVDLIAEHYQALVSHHAVHRGVPLGVRIARKHFGWYLDTTDLQRPLETRERDVLFGSDDPNQVVPVILSVWADAVWLRPVGRESGANTDLSGDMFKARAA